MKLLLTVLSAAGAFLTFSVLYHVMLAVVRLFSKTAAQPHPHPAKRFAVVVPAHNEELFLPRLLKSLRQQRYDSALVTVIVVADNCNDRTALIARRCGAVVFERNDPENAGKGQAIRFALERVNVAAHDAVVIVDADSVAAKDFLAGLNLLLLQGHSVIQCYNGVANPDESWFTRLLDVSRTLGNEIYLPAKQRLGLSSYLMGNGMCFSSRVLLQYGWDAFTVGEDWEYYARLVEQGEIIAFAGEARVYHQESQTLRQATSQRLRWSSGRFAVAGKYGLRLFFSGIRERNIRKMDAALPLLLPNPSLGMNIALLGLLASLVPYTVDGSAAFALWFAALIVVQVLLFTAGVLRTRHRLRRFLSLFVAPVFLAWKMAIDAFSLLGMGRKKWVRTERKL